jgi:hypothetical protein
VISYNLRDIGGYLVIVGYICYHGKESCDDVNRGRMESILLVDSCDSICAT